jgi:zinc protease
VKAAKRPRTARVTEDAKNGVTELVLPNGLVALVVPRRAAPVVSVQTWYRVGSREEEKGQTGLAHFLEHLLFKGTAELRRGDIDRVTLRNGGSNNADTTTDRTRYFFNFASDRWERALEIEADRMRGSAFDEREFRAERGPVLEELRRDRDDPWWRLHETLESTAFQVHPYHNPVIGWAEEVAKVPRKDVLAFYDAWYQPANCTIVVCGDVDPAAALDAITSRFASIPSKRLPKPFVPEEPPQEGERRFELELVVNVPRLIAGFHTVRTGTREDSVLDVIQAMLAAGKSSRLYDRLVRRDALATDASAWNDARRDPGLFIVSMELQDGVPPAKAEAALWDEFDRFVREGPTAAELERARSMLRASLVYRAATTSGQGELIGSLHVLAGDWRLYATLLPTLESITAAEVREVAGRFFRRANRTVGWALPRDASAPRVELDDEDVHEDAAAAPEETRPEPAILHREAPRGKLRVDLPVRRVTLDNGLRVLLLPRRELPVLAVRVQVEAGQVREGRPGAAAFVGECLDEGAGGRGGQEIARVIESCGAALATGAMGASLRCLSQDAGRCLDVLADVVLRPDFAPDVVERKRGELVSAVAVEDDDPSVTGRLRLRREIYGAHPLARRDKGGAEALRALTRDDLVRHHGDLFVPRNAILAAVGDFDPAAMEDEIRRRFEGWADRAPRFAPAAAPLLGAAREIHVEEDRDQLHVHMGHLGVRRADPDWYALLVGDFVLGSGPGMTDRLSRKLRDEMGLAYTVYARIARGADIEPGTFSAYIGTAPAQRARAIEGMRAEIERFVAGPVLASEVEDARRYLVGGYVFGFETADLTADQIVQMERLQLGFEHPAEFVRRVEAVTADDVLAAVRRHIHPDRLVTVTVGRAAGAP